MSIINRILGRKESRASLSLENPNTSIGDTIVDNIFNTDVSVNEATVLSIPAVKRAVSVLSSTIAGLPISIGQKQKGGFIQKDDSHELSYLLNYEPNEVNDKVKFFEVMITNLLVHGNAFAIINRNKDFKVTSLNILHPDLVTVKVLKNGSVRYEQNLVNNKKKSFKPYEVIHLQGQSSNGFIGFSNLDLHKETFELALQVIKFGKSYYENGGFMSGIIKHPASLSDNAHKRLKNSLTRYSGSSKAGKQLILDEGMSYETLTINPSQAGFVEVNQYLIGEFSRIFGVPPFILSDLSKSTMQNVESLTLSFVKHTVIEHLNRLESELSRKLLTEAEKISGYCINFNLDELLKADSRTRGDYIKNLFNVGALTINEVRLMEGLAPLDSEEADKTYIQINMGSVQDKDLVQDTKNEDRSANCRCKRDYLDDSDYYDELEERDSKTYSDYPQSVRNNAKRGIKLNEAVNNKCATSVGKKRASDLAAGRPLSMSTIKRMYSYLSRAEEYYNPSDTKACGTISYLLWGGKSAKSWAESKIKQNDKKSK